MLIDLFNKQPYDSEPETEDDDFQDQINEQMQCHYYNIHAKDIMPNPKTHKTSKSKDNKSI